MPATEQTWRNQKRLHFIFGATGLALLLSTLWMFAADHDRSWKDFQKTARAIDVQMSTWREQQYATDEFEARTRELERQIEEARASGLPEATLAKFEQEVNADARTRGVAVDDFENVKALNAELTTAAKQAAEARQAVLDAQVNVDRLTTQREAAEEAIKAAADDAERVRQLESDLASLDERIAEARQQLEESRERETEAVRAASRPRQRVMGRLEKYVNEARHREEVLLQQRKFEMAELDAQRASLGLAVRDARPLEEQNQMQREINEKAGSVAELTRFYQKASQHRIALQSLLTDMTGTQSELEKELEDHLADRKRLESAIAERRSGFFTGGLPGKRWLELPILDAFSSPLKVENLWSDGLEQDYNFRKVRRFDRCTTCHQGMTKTLPGSAVDPAFVHERRIELTLLAQPAADASAEGSGDESAEVAPPPAQTGEEFSIEKHYGLLLADEGLLTADDVTVSFVAPQSLAATANIAKQMATKTGADIRAEVLQPVPLNTQDATPGLMLGDVIEKINGDDVRSLQQTRYRLEQAARSGETLTLTVRRGLPHPYVSHPRLDLFVGSLSPHNVAEFACTICHDGQGSATEFQWASHTPNSPREQQQWADKYGWFDNHHWIYPMNARRFLESTCLKCHHEVTELEPSSRFPDAPAPKLVQGYELITKYGCYGCHEINGYSGNRRIGPDLRLEPNFFAAAQSLKNDASYDSLSDDQKASLEQLIHNPERDDIRRNFYQLLLEDDAGEKKFTEYARQEIAPMLKDLDSPGTLRKPGPSLRFVNDKLDSAFLYDWIRDPQNFRPSTRMPKFFGLWDHLSGEGRNVAEEFEPVEILGIVHFLQQRSQPFEYLPRPEGISDSTPEEKIERGKVAFQERGCLACHSHKEFPEIANFRPAGKIQQGPDLSNLGDKFNLERNPKSRDWLYTWIKQPERYHVRTVMPDLFLDPVEVKDAQGQTVGVHDPVDDIVEFLLSDAPGVWKPAAGTLTQLDDQSRAALDKLATEHLRDSFYEAAVADYLEKGIPQEMAPELKGAEKELLVPEGTEQLSDEQKLLYVGRKSITKYGCYGCHDIAGFEDAKPIGTGLADWGRKEPAKLAFEHIAQYLEGHGHGAAGHGAAAHSDTNHGEADHSAAEGRAEERAEAAEAEAEEAADAETEGDEGGEAHTTSVAAAQVGDDADGFYHQQLMSGNRIGFIYQKLREPRSYDYHKTENKRYNERLRMPQFPFNDEQREAVITFVLGLVADPPSAKYVYQADERQKAIIAGRKVLDKYNCGGCHMLDGEHWQLAYSPGAYGEQQLPSTYPFVLDDRPASVVQEAANPDRRNKLYSTVVALPTIGNDGLPVVNDDVFEPLFEEDEYNPQSVAYSVQLLKSAIIDGHVYQSGGVLDVPHSRIKQRYPSEGGDLTKYLLPHVVAREQEFNPSAKGSEAWGWLPPPLVGEGTKVQTEWLHSFLLNPYPIRPAVVLRMPRFNMSSDEASVLVNYFAARDDADYPYEYAPRRQSRHLQVADRQYQQQVQEATGEEAAGGVRFEHAMQIVTNKNYCVQCHIVGDFNPQMAVRGKAPDLSRVYQRLRPGYLRQWIAKPQSILPYTGMPVNIPYDPAQPFTGSTVPQNLYHGNSMDQLDGVVDLLMNFDAYAQQRSPVQPLVQQQADQAPPGETPAGEEPETSEESEATTESTAPATTSNAASEDDATPGATESPAETVVAP